MLQIALEVDPAAVEKLREISRLASTLIQALEGVPEILNGAVHIIEAPLVVAEPILTHPDLQPATADEATV